MDEPTELLLSHSGGDPNAAENLLPLVYDRLRALAAKQMRGERASHTLQPTAVVHEAYMRLIDGERVDWKGRTHFFALAARCLGRVLVDHARIRDAEKRGGGRRPDGLTFVELHAANAPVELLDLAAALERLGETKERLARVVELRFLAGLSLDECAEALDCSRDTVKRDWRVARAWLNKELGGDDSE